MRVEFRKPLSDDEAASVENIANSCGILFDTARLLFCRGIDTVEKVKVFLSPSKAQFLDPFLFPEMKRVTERLYRARDNGEKVLISGDYDADGICASAVLSKCLKEFGIENGIIIPEREDGYGICLPKVLKKIENEGFSILITVDCGISEKDKIETLKNYGVDVIVTDHHEPPEVLPDCPIINPKVDAEYPFSALCGAGVAYKLGHALIGKSADKYLDFVSLATVADSMDLTGENRAIVKEGLKLFGQNKIRDCFKYLFGGKDRVITAQSLAFILAPRVNAGGRLGDANSALKLFLSDDENEIFDLSVKLNGYNTARQAECDEIYRFASEKIRESGAFRRNVIMVYDKKWNAGVVGIVAAKLVEDYNRPVVVFAGHGDDLKGSARSVDGVNIYEAISGAKEFLTGFGGHSQAAGVSLKEENFSLFYDFVDKYLEGQTLQKTAEETVFCEWETDRLSVRFAKELDALEPFGTGNKKPLFAVSCGRVNPVPLKIGSGHYSFTAGKVDLLYFNGEKDVFALRLPVRKKLVYEVNYSVYKGHESAKGYLKTIVPEFGNDDLSDYYFQNELVKIKKDCTVTFNLIDNAEVKQGLGTLFILLDEEKLSFYNKAGLPVSYFTPENSGINSVCISASSIPTCYEKVVYLEKPLAVLDTKAENYVVNDSRYLDRFKALKTDRETFAEVFSVLKTLHGKEFTGSVEFYSDNKAYESARQFIFCLEVFLELGIFSERNGRLYYDAKVKNALDNSKIYRRIAELKG